MYTLNHLPRKLSLEFFSPINLPYRALEAHIARLAGKEAGLFVTSGTASNQLALRSHLLQPPYTVMVDHRAHIYKSGFHFISRPD